MRCAYAYDPRVTVAQRAARRRPAAATSTPPDRLDEAFASIGLTRDYSALDLDGLTLDVVFWTEDTPIYESLFAEARPALVIEVGSWKGASVLQMDEVSRRLGLETRFVCVDTWLGSSDHWLDAKHAPSLMLRSGYPSMFRQFVFNVVSSAAAERIYPLPMTSTSGARVLERLGVVADIVYIDAGHEREEVAADAAAYFDLLRPGGILFGDDYHPKWPGVVKAARSFARRRLLRLETRDQKWIVRRRRGAFAQRLGR
jgi:Methyltransferase domain